MAELIKQPEDIRLQANQELQEALGKPPGWLQRWGISLIALFVILLLSLSWIIRYPDEIQATIELVTANPPIAVVAPVSGKLEVLHVEDQESVSAGDLLAVLENPANAGDIDILRRLLSTLAARPEPSVLVQLQIPRDLNLGGLQTTYANFVREFEAYDFFTNKDVTSRRIANLEAQIMDYRRLNKLIDKDLVELERVIVLADSLYQMQLDDYNVGGLSKAELKRAEAQLLERRREKSVLMARQVNNDIEARKLEMQITDIRQIRAEGNSEGLGGIWESVRRLQAELQEWEQQYLIKASISGRIALPQNLTAQQFVTANSAIMTIVPVGASSAKVAKGIMPRFGAGKVKIGAPVTIRLEDYPYQEYGILRTTVKKIALVPEADGYLLEMTLPDALITSYGNEIEFKQQMRGSAKIITENRRLLARILDRIWDILYNQDERSN